MRVKVQNRRGSVLITVAAFMLVFIMIIALAVDYGYLLVVRTDLQRAADAAALAAVWNLIPDEMGEQSDAVADARESVRYYISKNLRSQDESLTIPDTDIEIGRYDRATINSGNVTLLSDGMLDAVRVTIRRDGTANSAVPLFFGRVFGANRANVVVRATAVLRPAKVLVPGNGVLPFAVDINIWDQAGIGDEFVMYGDGRFEDGEGNPIPGNWGTVDIGDSSNSTSDLRDQIENGLRQSDLDALASELGPYGEPRLPNNTELAAPLWVGGDPGLSAGMQHALDNVMGVPKAIPLIDQVAGGGGNNSEFHIVGWGIVKLTSFNFQGKNKQVTVQRLYAYDGTMKPSNDLSDTTNLIDGAFTTAGLVE